MKKAIIISLIFILLILVVSGGCTKTTTPTTTAPTTPTTPTAVNQDVVPKQAGCGDKICAENEMCDESTHVTVCPEDCGIRCWAYITVSGPTCEGSCSVSGNTVTIKESSKVILTLKNTGEMSTDTVSTSFRCDYADGSGLYMKTELGEKNGYEWDDSFEGGREEDTVNGMITGNNNLDYILYLSGVTKNAVDLVCRSSFSSTSFTASKTFNYNINFR